MKSSFYLKHDLDAREDEKMRALLMKHGAKAYGIYWMIVEDLYRGAGRLARDYAAMSWAYHEPQQEIKSIAENFGLFYDANGKIGCKRVDRDLDSRREASKRASMAGRASAAKRSFNARSTPVQPGEERRGEEGENRTTAGAPPLAVGSLPALKSTAGMVQVRIPFGKDRGRLIQDLSVDECRYYLGDSRLGSKIRAALKDRIASKQADMTDEQRKAAERRP